MSSVSGGSGRSGVSRKAQQDYHAKEQALIKKHKRETTRLQEDHERRIRNLQQEQSDTMDKYRAESRRNMLERDARYQKESQEMRDLHREQMRKLAEANDRNVNTLDRTRKAEYEKMQAIGTRQQELLQSRHQQDIKHLDKRFNMYVDSSRKEQERARTEIQNKLENAHQEKLEYISNRHDERLAKAQKDLAQVKRIKGEEVTSLKEALVAQRNDMSSRHIAQVRIEQDHHERRMKDRAVTFDNSLNRLKNKFGEAVKKEAETSEAHRQDLKESVQARAYANISALERKVAQLKLANTAGFQDLKRQYETEKQSIIDSYERQNQIMVKQREDALVEFNKTGKKDNQTIRTEFDDKFRRNNLFHMNRIEDLERRQAEQLEAMVMDAERKQKRVENRADQRVEVLKVKADTERRERETYFKNAITEAKRGFSEQLRDQRIANTQEKQRMVSAFRKEMEKIEDAHNERFVRKINHYEKQIEEINDRNLRKLRSMNRQHQRLLEQEQRQSELEKDTIQLQYQDKVAQLQATHKEETDRMARVHQEELNRLALAKRNTTG